ncbi:MAG TPA: hypothetical protein VG916_15335 [Gemmatimonadaceae bacterium]|nr:hypothetical protein [Gemmatimonadaceae bacterium]
MRRILGRAAVMPVVVALLLAPNACASLHGPGLADDSRAVLVVDSHNDATFDVFAIIGEGYPHRLGTVMGFSKVTFPLPREVTALGTVRIVAVPIGGFGAANSGPVLVHGGDTVVFTLEHVLSWSSAVVK